MSRQSCQLRIRSSHLRRLALVLPVCTSSHSCGKTCPPKARLPVFLLICSVMAHRPWEASADAHAEAFDVNTASSYQQHDHLTAATVFAAYSAQKSRKIWQQSITGSLKPAWVSSNCWIVHAPPRTSKRLRQLKRLLARSRNCCSLQGCAMWT